ncbi:putative 37S ribosomal protein S5, mitochondrial [Amylocarpus encephaloides]|uniref:Small ribosomal subunit protein uS5m n=1 Tax=Amylocarpus encephaloides TaxID=45428 RepID=A0A9P7YSU4_9HELO|nr:putative 37S ribosomal protein S5, mitochondrial [Amylocarpus encephaloides]
MSASRPVRCLLSGPSIPRIRPVVRCRNFHTSPNLCERKPRYPSIKASDMGLVAKEKKLQARENFKPYTAEEKAALSQRYTPDQIRAIEAGEEAIDPEDLDKKGIIRTGWGSLEYLDDFSQIKPVIDRAPGKFELQRAPVDPKARMMTEREILQSDFEFDEKVIAENPMPKDIDYTDEKTRATIRPNVADLFRGLDEAPMFMGSDGPISQKDQSLIAPGVPMDFESDISEGLGIKKTKAEEADIRDPEGNYDRLRKQTGLTLDEILDLNPKILVMHRVVNQTRLGKIQSMYCLAISGDGNGRLGLGQAKGQESVDTMLNARIQAIKNMKPIPRYERRTIYGEVEGKVSAAEVKLMSRPPGFGLRCQHLIFEMCRAAGIQDIAAKVPRSRNKMNTVKATYQALMSQRIPDEVARGRGKKLVDVRKVYYGGRV